MSSPELRRLQPVSPRDMVASGLCIGCGACVGRCAEASMRWDHYGQLKPSGPACWLGERSAEFAVACPFSPAAADEDEIAAELFPNATRSDPHVGPFEGAYVGHAAEDGFRAAGSSGGLVSWVAVELLRRGLVDGVAHVVAADPRVDGRFFRYRISRSEAEVRQGAKSRYYPVELSGVLEEIRVRPGRYAVVGIPCFVKAINLLRRTDPVIRERVAFTLGLFCGQMKSARMVESFAWQMDADIADVDAIDYRLKDPSRPANWYTAQLTLRGGGERRRDWWHLADGDWGAGFFQNSACDWCDDVVGETADISFGDAWVEPYSSDGRGTNVVVVRSPLLHGLVRTGIADGRLALEPVDAAFVERTQAAGFRHRREGLAWRLGRRRSGVRPRKRFAELSRALPARRRLVYWTRWTIARWSHRVHRIARAAHKPRIYTGWARAVLTLYQGLAWSHGRAGRVADRLFGESKQA